MADFLSKRSKAILASLIMIIVWPNTLTELIGPSRVRVSNLHVKQDVYARLTVQLLMPPPMHPLLALRQVQQVPDQRLGRGPGRERLLARWRAREEGALEEVEAERAEREVDEEGGHW